MKIIPKLSSYLILVSMSGFSFAENTVDTDSEK